MKTRFSTVNGLGLIGLVLWGTAVATATPSPPETLAGVALGATVSNVSADHPGAKKLDISDASNSVWEWHRAGGGAVRVTTDAHGTVTRIEFVARRGEDDDVDVPCAPHFPVQSSHVNLQLALGGTNCARFSLSGSTDVTARLDLSDGSVAEILFQGPADGQLSRAVWYRPDAAAKKPRSRQ